MAKNTYGGRVANSDWVRRRNGLWIPTRKRLYLYWFKYLQHAETAPNTEFEVDWSKYRGWGGGNEVLGMKFDAWWEDKWEKLFSYKGAKKAPPLNKQKFGLTTTKPQTESIRTALLVYEARDTKPDWTPKDYGGKEPNAWSRRGGNTLAIARRIIAKEKRSKRYMLNDLWGIDLDANPDIIENEVQSRVGRYMRQAKKILGNVCDGKFP